MEVERDRRWVHLKIYIRFPCFATAYRRIFVAHTQRGGTREPARIPGSHFLARVDTILRVRTDGTRATGP